MEAVVGGVDAGSVEGIVADVGSSAAVFDFAVGRTDEVVAGEVWVNSRSGLRQPHPRLGVNVMFILRSALRYSGL